MLENLVPTIFLLSAMLLPCCIMLVSYIVGSIQQNKAYKLKRPLHNCPDDCDCVKNNLIYKCGIDSYKCPEYNNCCLAPSNDLIM